MKIYPAGRTTNRTSRGHERVRERNEEEDPGSRHSLGPIIGDNNLMKGLKCMDSWKDLTG